MPRDNDKPTGDSAENITVDDENVNNSAEVSETENSENFNSNTEDDDVMKHLENLFPNPKLSPIHGEDFECIASVHAPDSQEYFSPTDGSPCPSVQTLSCNDSNLQNLVSVSVQSEPVTLISQAVQYERPLLVEKSIQCLIVPPRKETESKSTCTSPLTKNHSCDVCERGVNCDLISTTGLQHSAEESGGFCQSVNLPSLQEVDATNLVSSSQTSLHSCSSSSCHSPRSSEIEVMRETSDGFCSPSTVTKHHKLNSGSNKNKLQDHCSRTSSVFTEKKSKTSDCDKTECQVHSEEIACQSSPPRKSCDKGSAYEFSSQELIIEMGSPIRLSQMTEKNKNNCLSESGKSCGVQRKPIQESHKPLSEKQEHVSIPATSTPVQVEKTDVFIFNSLACERESSPESLDDDTCDVLMHTATRLTIFPKAIDTSALGGKQKKSCDTKSNNRQSHKDVTIQRKSMPHNKRNSNEAIPLPKPQSYYKLVPYSNSDSNHDSESPHQFSFCESSDSSTARKRKQRRQQRDETLRKSARFMEKSRSTTTRARDPKELLDSDSDSESEAGTVLRTSDSRQNRSSRSSYNKGGKEATNASNTKEPHIIVELDCDSGSEAETVTALHRKSETRKSSSNRSTYNKREIEATHASNLKEQHIIVESLDSDSEAETVTVSCRTSDTKRSYTRMNYSKKEKETILCFLVDHRSYKRIKGRRIWQDMEEAEVCPGRTWQSLKEHFIKQILPRIESFGLNSAIEKKFISMRRKY